MEKSTKREAQYRAILERKSLRLEDCRVLAFSFNMNPGLFIFHYDIMNTKSITHYLFDIVGKRVFIIIPDDDATEKKVVELAEYRGGERITANLR